ncbi:nucleotidyltransferase domain-containing protein [soil metagenome]
MVEKIGAGLDEIESRHEVRVLYACESGSRAWGFESPDSDYDVRFIYARSRDQYLSVDEPRDTIEFITDEDLDYAGWDLRKALRLLRKSNPSLIEWIGSPTVYRDTEGFLAALREQAALYLDLSRLDHHYGSMARSNYQTYLLRDEVPRKKYLYALRPLLCRRWIRAYRTSPPVPFSSLVEATIRPEEREALDRLLAEKRLGLEMVSGPRDPLLHAIIESEISLPEIAEEAAPGSDLDEFFRAWIRES